MSAPSLKAAFFVSIDGTAICKAPPLTFKERRVVFERDGGVCGKCLRQVRLGGRYDTPFDSGPRCGEIDHILPRSRGGQNDGANLRLLCKSCNAQKGAR